MSLPRGTFDRSLIRLLLSVASLVSFCGGPLVLFDLLKPRIGSTASFGVCLPPVLLMMLGAQSLTLDYAGARPGVRSVRLGLLGSLVTLAMHGYGVFLLATDTTPRKDGALLVIGLMLGIPIAMGFAVWSKQWLDRFRDPLADMSLPIDPRSR